MATLTKHGWRVLAATSLLLVLAIFTYSPPATSQGQVVMAWGTDSGGLGHPLRTDATGNFLLSNADPCSSTALPGNKPHVFKNITTATTTALVAPSGAANIFVCEVDVQLNSSTASSILLENGTGVACATSPNALTATYSNATLVSEPLRFGGGNITWLLAGASQGLCALTTVGTSPTISVDVVFAQQ